MSPKSRVTLADGGIETALTDRLGQELPEFAAFVLLDTDAGRSALRDYYTPFLELAERTNSALVLDTPTWRANPDWVRLLGLNEAEVTRINADAVKFMKDLVADAQTSTPVTINGCVGPRFDDFEAAQRMSADEAAEYHRPQVEALARAGADRVTSVTTIDVPEAVGVVRAAGEAGIPVAVSFTVGEDGRLPSGDTLAEAIRAVDAETAAAPEGYLVNCAHPSEVEHALQVSADEETLGRIIGFRLNAARHGDDGAGDAPDSFARGLLKLRDLVPSAEVFGGCCGTDVPHITEVAAQSG